MRSTKVAMEFYGFDEEKIKLIFWYPVVVGARIPIMQYCVRISTKVRTRLCAFGEQVSTTKRFDDMNSVSVQIRVILSRLLKAKFL